MYVAINPDSMYVYRNMAIHINATCICTAHLRDSFSEKPLSRTNQY